jgi:hypothetical protein
MKIVGSLLLIAMGICGKNTAQTDGIPHRRNSTGEAAIFAGRRLRHNASCSRPPSASYFSIIRHSRPRALRSWPRTAVTAVMEAWCELTGRRGSIAYLLLLRHAFRCHRRYAGDMLSLASHCSASSAPVSASGSCAQRVFDGLPTSGHPWY